MRGGAPAAAALLLLAAAAAPCGARQFVEVAGQNAVPSGPKTTQKSAAACEAACAGGCLQFAWNTKSGHCYTSDSAVWDPEPSDHVTSGCVAGAVSGCPAAAPTPAPAPTPPPPPVPRWTAPAPDRSRPLAGYPLVAGTTQAEVIHGSPAVGTYNHAAMIDYFAGRFIVAWKNGPTTEDKAGQRILYSQSDDGATWTPSDGANVLFPDMTTTKGPVKGPGTAALFVGPPAHVNGRLYLGASPGQPTSAAQGAQFCLWPDPVSPRNCGPPGHKQASGTLLLREVRADGAGSLGPIFWAGASAPSLWAEASQRLGIKTLPEMDAQTQADVAALRSDLPALPCGGAAAGTLKCEACLGGCQLYDDIPKDSGVGNERAHYDVPSSAADVILYRSGSHPYLYASVRGNRTAGQRAWGAPQPTDIPNDESNLNAGPLPDGRIYLLNNALDWPKAGALGAEGGLGTLRYRDPITVATSRDGYAFDTAAALMSCSTLTGSNETCRPRYCAGKPNTDKQASCDGKNPGPSYPQGVAVVAPAPEGVRGFYAVASLNKEDVWVVKAPFASL